MAISMRTKEQTERLALIKDCDLPAFFHPERAILQGMPMILSNGKDCLLVQNGPLDPLWIWTSGSVSDETLEDILFAVSALREEGKLRAVVARKQIARLFSVAFENVLGKRRELLVYAMDSLCPQSAGGRCVPGSEVDPAVAGELIAVLTEEEGETLPPERRNRIGMAFTQSGDSFAWETETGEIAAIARIAEAGDRYTCLHTVVTRPEQRNRGYAKALLSEICGNILAKGRIPMLYAYRDYAPSNAVYRKIGFTVKDRLAVLRFCKKE